jgi:hypothetical protein
MEATVAFTDKELDRILETAQRRIEAARLMGRHDYLRAGQDSFLINAYGVRGEWAVAKALDLDESPVFRNGVSFRADLILRLGGKEYKVEVKGPMGRDRRLALTAHHSPDTDIKADAYFCVWPYYDVVPAQRLEALADPVEIRGYVPRGLFQRLGYWRTLKEGRQWCLDPEHFKTLDQLPLPHINIWPIEENPFGKEETPAGGLI